MFRAIRLAIILLIGCNVVQAESSSTEIISFNIDSQPLSAALLDYSYQTKVQLIMPGRLVKGMYSEGLVGQYTAEDGLQALLKNTRLQFEFTSPSTVSIREPIELESKISRRRRSNLLGIDHIIVTAQGREEKLQDVSLAVTALEGSDLEKRGVNNADQLQVFVPGLTVESAQLADTSFTLRGIGASSDNIAIEPGVAVYIDDIYIPRHSAANMTVFDLQRVEVLRGPQGTLYGKNTPGGAIRYVTYKPDANYEARYLLDIGNEGRINNTFTLNGELADDVYAQLGIASLRRQGLMRNQTAGQARGDEVDSIAGRASFRYLPRDDVELLMTMDSERTDQAGVLYSLGPEDGFQLHSSTIALPASKPLRSSKAGFTGRDKRSIDGLMLRANIETTSANISYIVGARRHVIESSYDLDQQVADLASRSNIESSDSLTAEMRFISKRDSVLSFKNKVEWAAGLYFAKDRQQERRPFDLTGLGFGENTWHQRVSSQSSGLYAQGDYALSPSFRLTTGLRYTIDDKRVHMSASSTFANASNPLLKENFMLIKSKRWSQFTPKLALSYAASDNLLSYVSYTRGYKAGGFRGSMPDLANRQSFILPSEESNHYELGLKSRLFDNRAKFNLVMFYVDYDNLQVRESGLFGLNYIASAPKSVIKGFEVDIQARPVSSLNISLGVSSLNSEFKQFSAERNGVVIDRTGESVPGVPDVTVNASVAYYFTETRYGFYSLRLDAIYSDGALLEKEIQGWPSYQVYNLWFDFIPRSDQWEAGLWVRNLLDEVYYRNHLSTLSIQQNAVARKLEPPRTIGVSFKFKW